MPAVALVLAGCMIREAPPGSSIADADRWETVRSQHFLVHTDAGRGAIDDILSRFELTHQALAGTFFPQAVVTEVEAMVFAEPDEYRRVAGDTAGKFIPGIGATGSMLVVKHVDDRDYLERVVAHELVHRFADAAYPRLPNWMDEGLAMFLESIEVREDEVRFGAAPRQAGHVFAVGGEVSFDQLIQADPATLYGPDARYYYSAGWALVHHLLTSRGGALRGRFPQLLRVLEETRGARVSARWAFDEVYPDVPASELDEAIQRLTRSLGRPAVETLIVVPFKSAAPQSFARRPAQPEAVQALAAQVARRNWRPPAPRELDLTKRPQLVGANAQIAVPLRYVGLVYGRMLRPPWAWEAEVGHGRLGHQAGARIRVLRHVGEGQHLFVSAALGPVLAVKGRALGTSVEHFPSQEEPGGLYWFLAVEPELAAEVRTPSRVLLRLSLSGHLGLLGNLDDLCRERGPGVATLCDPADGRSGARIAQDGGQVFGRVTVGYTW